jgi:hypothetical protein
VDVICYVLGGIMVGVLLLIYYPVCRWYLKADAAIKDLIESEGQGETMTTSREMSRDLLMQNPVEGHDEDMATVENS